MSYDIAAPSCFTGAAPKPDNFTSSSNATLGISRVSLDISTAATTAALPIRIVDWKGGYDGDEKGTAFPIMLCKFNTGHQLGIGAVSGNAPSAA